MRLSMAVAAACLSVPLLAQAPAPAAPASAVSAEEAIPVEPGEGGAVAQKLADQLLSDFVYRDQAQAYAAMLERNAAAGRYDNGTRGEVARRMTGDLMAVHKDGHLHVMVAEPDDVGPGGGDIARKFPPLVQSAKTIAPGIGYIRFSAFLGQPEEMAAVRKWLADNRDANTLIFDLRNHHGGGLDEQDAIFSYLYAEKTPLVKMAISRNVYDSGGSPLEGGPTLVFGQEGDKMVATHSALPGPDTPLRKARVYLLISNRTASAAEHFALALKSTGRAALIGEATAGANHFGGGRPLSEHFGVWLPVGRTYDIKTARTGRATESLRTSRRTRNRRW